MKRCLILGDARNVRADAAGAFELFTPDAIFATNNIGLHWEGQVDFWVTLHPMPCHDWVGMASALEKRAQAGRNAPECWAHNHKGGVPNRSSDWGGSTGLLAVKIAREKAFDKIVLAGVPMSSELGHFYDKKPWGSANGFRRAWQSRVKMIGPFVRSMSGWTRELFGEPTAEWLAAETILVD